MHARAAMITGKKIDAGEGRSLMRSTLTDASVPRGGKKALCISADGFSRVRSRIEIVKHYSGFLSSLSFSFSSFLFLSVLAGGGVPGFAAGGAAGSTGFLASGTGIFSAGCAGVFAAGGGGVFASGAGACFTAGFGSTGLSGGAGLLAGGGVGFAAGGAAGAAGLLTGTGFTSAAGAGL